MYHQTKKWAQRNGARLLRKMKGKGWRLRIHENTGWHFCVERKFPAGFSVKVYQRDSYSKRLKQRLINEYWCLFGPTGGLAVWTGNTSSRDPNVSVAKQLNLCRVYSDEIQHNVDGLQRLVDQAKGRRN